MEIIPFLGLIGVVLGASIAWRRAQLNQRTQYTFELYRYFYSDDFSKVRTMARNFRAYLEKHQKLCTYYFIYIDINDLNQETRQEYYELITSYAGVLYFFSWLVEHLNARLITKRSLIRLFKHVFEWWYLHSIKAFIIIYERELQNVNDVDAKSLRINRLASKPPWVANLKKLSEMMQLDSWPATKNRC